MSTTSQPFGVRPAYHPSGVVRPTAFTIRSGYGSNILQNQVVRIVPSSTGEGTLEAATIDQAFIGVFQGVEFTDGDGRRRVSNKWLANQVGTEVVAYATLDPTIVYEVQADGSLDVDSIGKQFDLVSVSAGNTTVGLSQAVLDTGSSASNAAFRVIGVANAPDNAFGDNFTIVQVQISEHQMVADKAAF
jgi:hypothetical protein